MIKKVATAMLTFSAFLASVSAENGVDFERDVYRILRKACFECHDHKKQEGELRLDDRAQFLSSGTVVPGSRKTANCSGVFLCRAAMTKSCLPSASQ